LFSRLILLTANSSLENPKLFLRQLFWGAVRCPIVDKSINFIFYLWIDREWYSWVCGILRFRQEADEETY